MLIAIKVPASTFLMPVQTGHGWDIRISVIQEQTDLWSMPNAVEKWWSRAVLTALPGGCAPGGQVHLCLRKSWSWWLWSQLALGEVHGGGRALLLTEPCAGSWESTGLWLCVCRASCPSPSIVPGPFLRHIHYFRNRHLSLTAALYQ